MAFTAALAVLFESIRWLRGSVGNIVYFFLFISGITVLAILLGTKQPLLDWLGFGLFSDSMGAAARAVYPTYERGFSLSMVPGSGDFQTFVWSGVEWTLPVIFIRMTLYIWAIGLTLLGAAFFDRFDPSHGRVRIKPGAAADLPEPASVAAEAPAQAVQLTPLSAGRTRVHFGALYLTELRFLLKGQPWWWYLVAVGLIVASVFAHLDSIRHTFLPAILIWPLLIWSGLGCRETRHFTRQIVFAAPRPLRNQLPTAWLAGFTVSILMGAGIVAKFLAAGEMASLLSLVSGLLFIPSLALMLGVWTGSSKAFEVLYVLFWYLGPLNKVLELDYVGIHTRDYWEIYLFLAASLIALAFLGRRRQIQSD
jgi:hypothetical protein